MKYSVEEHQPFQYDLEVWEREEKIQEDMVVDSFFAEERQMIDEVMFIAVDTNTFKDNIGLEDY